MVIGSYDVPIGHGIGLTVIGNDYLISYEVPSYRIDTDTIVLDDWGNIEVVSYLNFENNVEYSEDDS